MQYRLFQIIRAYFWHYWYFWFPEERPVIEDAKSSGGLIPVNLKRGQSLSSVMVAGVISSALAASARLASYEMHKCDLEFQRGMRREEERQSRQFSNRYTALVDANPCVRSLFNE